MQNKGLIKFLTWAFALACLFQLSFTVVTTVIEGNAKTEAENYVNSKDVQAQIMQLANNDKNKAQILQDSIQQVKEESILLEKADQKVYLGYTYRDCQSREINLGLDLKGGMNVMLEVSTSEVVRQLAGNHKDDPKLNDILGSLPGATITGFK